jgi:general secretion pathway protein G
LLRLEILYIVFTLTFGKTPLTQEFQNRTPIPIPKMTVTFPNQRKSAFTLIELLVVMAIIGILVSITLAISGGANRKAALDKARADVQAIANALEQYKAANDIYPAPGNGNTVPYDTSGDNSIRPFFTASRISTNSSGQLEDPYGNPYQYSTNRTGMKNPASFDVWSKGQDGADNSTDDIGNW